MADDDGQEKRHDASEQKLKKAAEKGQVPKSTEVSNAASVLVAFATLVASAPLIGRNVQGIAERSWSLSGTPDFNPGSAIVLFRDVMETALISLAPVLGALLITGLLANLLQTRFQLATKALEPKAERLDPVENFKSKFLSPQPLMELFKGLMKLGALGGVIWLVARTRVEALPSLALLSTEQQLIFLKESARTIVLGAMPLLIVIAVADYAYNRFKLNKDLKMTDQEVKEERKEQEGDPMVKAQRRARARQIAMSQNLARVKEATLVVTNPTHYAVAIRYVKDETPVPIVVAMGIDHMALKIRAEARRHGVPRIENRPLARSLHARSKVGQPIPEELFGPVAKVLAVVYRRRANRAQ